MLAQPVSFVVFLLYWLLDNPVWKLCIVNDNAPSCHQTPSYLSFYVHGINCFALVLSFSIGRITFHFKTSFLLLFSYGACYFLWTLIHYGLKIGTQLPCEGYPRNECPIYNVLDWHNASKSVIIFAVVLFVVFPIASAVYTLIGHLRDMCVGAQRKKGDDATSAENTMADVEHCHEGPAQDVPMPLLLGIHSTELVVLNK